LAHALESRDSKAARPSAEIADVAKKGPGRPRRAPDESTADEISKGNLAEAILTRDAPAIPYEKVRDAVLAHVAVHGNASTLAVLQTLGVQNAQALKPESYAQALRAFGAGP
jgi:hypothetical protein